MGDEKEDDESNSDNSDDNIKKYIINKKF